MSLQHCSVLTHHTAVSAAEDLWPLTDSPVHGPGSPAPPPESEDRACAVETPEWPAVRADTGHRHCHPLPREIPSEIATITKHQFKSYHPLN